ncbi:MAG: hypothetical protein ACJA2W_002954 [Planctomycetota bacterium]|jgi:hypothetical protein
MTNPQNDLSGTAPPRKLVDVLFDGVVSDGILLDGDKSSKLYALLDAAKIENLLGVLAEFEPPSACLFSGKIEPSVALVAPYLVELEPGGSFSEWLLERYWGKDAGVFLLSELELKGVRKHLKQFTMARLPDGEQAFFRFYDPRVLRAYLPTCTGEEIDQFLGDVVQCFRVESERLGDGRDVLEFTRQGGSVATGQAVEVAAK